MLTAEEEKFYIEWEKNRQIPQYKRKPFLIGLSLGLLCGLLVLCISELGWYERANRVANSRNNLVWIIIAILFISIGIGWFYQQFTWEMNEQRYQEIKYLKSKK